MQPTDIVLEIGPGTGNLTVRMLPLVKKVIAFEVDERMVAELQKRVSGSYVSKYLKQVNYLNRFHPVNIKVNFK